MLIIALCVPMDAVVAALRTNLIATHFKSPFSVTTLSLADRRLDPRTNEKARRPLELSAILA